jgi:hypothetical protein
LYSKTYLNRTPLGLKNLFSLDRCLVYRFKLHRHLVNAYGVSSTLRHFLELNSLV